MSDTASRERTGTPSCRVRVTIGYKTLWTAVRDELIRAIQDPRVIEEQARMRIAPHEADAEPEADRGQINIWRPRPRRHAPIWCRHTETSRRHHRPGDTRRYSRRIRRRHPRRRFRPAGDPQPR